MRAGWSDRGFLAAGGALAGSFVLDVDDGEPEQLDDGVVGREVVAGLGDLAELVVQRLESFNREMRKVLKTRTQFPNDDPAARALWLAIVDIEEKRAEQRARQAGKPKNKRESVARLIGGHVTQGWTEAWAEMVALWPGRLADRM